MKVVIDIPEETVNTIKDNAMFAKEVVSSIKWDITNAIVNGTPLPKGHGRLIDYGYVVDAIDDWINAGEYNYTNATYYLRKRVSNVSTIIEEDKESGGEKE